MALMPNALSSYRAEALPYMLIEFPLAGGGTFSITRGYVVTLEHSINKPNECTLRGVNNNAWKISLPYATVQAMLMSDGL